MKIIFIGIFILFSQHSFSLDAVIRSDKELKNLIKHDCGSCHGLYLKGGLGPDLTPDRIKNFKDDFLFETIKNGRAPQAMPGWKSLLSDKEIRQIIVFLRGGLE